jgi:TonB family protein
MSAEPRRFTNAEGWSRWEGHLVKGIFPLRRFLGGSEQSAVFLSEYDAGKTIDVAIKLLPAIGSRAEAQLVNWRTAAALTHPNLVRLFNMGRCQLEGREFLFVVMEYGEQTLAEFLSERALTAAEVRALLMPTLDALAFLHANQLAHVRLKPSNMLVVNDQLKLSSDAIRAPGPAGISTAGDIWNLGMTLVEAFTQRTPSSPDEHDEANSLLANIPAQYASIVRRCLNPNPASRPTAIELQTQFKSAPEESAISEDRSHAHPVLLAIPATLLIVLAALINPQPVEDTEAKSESTAAPAPAATPAATPVKQEKPAARAERSERPARSERSEGSERSERSEQPAKPAPPPEAEPSPKLTRTVSTTSRTLVLEVTPEVPRAVSEKIQGRILITVRVLVDPSGNVMAAMVEKAGPNKSLANLADQAAREWKFSPEDTDANRVWILTFAFTREGVTARATSV